MVHRQALCALVLVVIGLTIVGASTTKKCSSDNDCISSNNWCSGCGACTDGNLGDKCCSDNDCSDPYWCNNGACFGGLSTGAVTSAGSTQGTTYNNVKITAYGWNDNDDGAGTFGNAVIAYPQIRHGKAVETSGLYSDPCTFAADPRFIAPGTIIYVPVLSKYYIMEDVCGGCTVEYSSGQKHVDLWIGPDAATLPEDPLLECEDAITSNGFDGTIIVNPASNLPVKQAKIFTNGVCLY